MLENISSAKPYLVIGNGKVAKHWMHYLSLEKIPFQNWSRQSRIDFPKNLNKFRSVFVLISDSAIAEFAQTHLQNSKIPLIHFSGAHSLDGIIDLHPLMTFGPDLYLIEDYRKIKFVSAKIESLDQVLPELANLFKIQKISPDQKALYHALCVIAGNFPTLMWQSLIEPFGHLGLSTETWGLLAEQSLKNFLNSPGQSLTGPIARKDEFTLQKNKEALQNLPELQRLYESFIEVYHPNKSKESR